MTNAFNILLVEDNRDLIEVISLIIQSHFTKKVNIHSAENLDLAKSILNQMPIDILICDHFLSSNETGADLLKYLKSNQLKTKFVLCSSYTPEQLIDLYPSGSCYFNIQKPEINEGLEKLIEKIEISHAPLSSEISYDYNERSLAMLSDQLNQIISSDDVPIDRKMTSSYLHAVQELKDNHQISDTLILNKNIILQIIIKLCEIDFLAQRYVKNPNEYLFPIYQCIFINLILRKIDLDTITVEENLYLMCFLINISSDKLNHSDLLEFDFNSTKKEIGVLQMTPNLKPKSQASAIFFITQKITEHYFENQFHINYIKFQSELSSIIAVCAINTEIIKILDSYFLEK